MFQTPGVLLGNMGLPMLAVVWPYTWIAFLPVVGVEAFILRSLRLATLRRSLLVSATANAVSTVVGVPVTWMILVFFQLAFGGGGFLPLGTTWEAATTLLRQAAWLPPYQDEIRWMIPCAALVLCVAFFFSSLLVEYLVARRFFAKEFHPRVRLWSWCANGITYLAAMACAALWISRL